MYRKHFSLIIVCVGVVCAFVTFGGRPELVIVLSIQEEE